MKRENSLPATSKNEVTPHPATVDIRATLREMQQGLTTTEANQRAQLYGANAFQTIRPPSAGRIFFSQFASLIVALLAVAALIAALTGDQIEALAIICVLILNALIGFGTEWQASRALEALRRQVTMTTRVRRDGQEVELDSNNLVPGDVVILNAGDLIPADARLIESANLRAEESALSGESAPVEKSIEPVAPETLIAEMTSMVWLGTAVVAGRAEAVVTAIGENTELGKIGKLVAEAPNEKTPLEIKLDKLGRQLVYAVLGIAAVVTMAGWLRGDTFWVMLEVSISLAVAAVPEALPTVTTLILAVGVLRMARQKALVRRLSAVETLGSTTVICSDKTGTLTENRMQVCEYHLTDSKTRQMAGTTVDSTADDLLFRALMIGILCNEATTSNNQFIGDPTETALLEVAQRLGLDIAALRNRYTKQHEIPFDSVTKKMVTLHPLESSGGKQFAALKGAPSVVLTACTNYYDLNGQPQLMTEPLRAQFLAANEEMAGRALRVLALAEKALNSANNSLETGYTLIGLVGMIDPPRQEVPEAIAKARAAGIHVVMLTGDQLQTAHAIAKELRLNGDQEPLAVHARELVTTNSLELANLARSVQVFARVSPSDKLYIVKTLQEAGEIVAVTGDGINDAPALKQADIGVAMGKRGTEVAKEAADIVLTDDNFATILHAIESGRTIYANIIKFVHLMLSKNLAVVLMIFVAILVGWPLPLLPLPILWINLVTDVFPAFALALEAKSPDVMSHPPRSPSDALLSRELMRLILWQALMLATIMLAAYGWALKNYGAGAHARTIALFAIIGAQLSHTFNCRSRTRSAVAGLLQSPFIWLSAAFVIGLQMLALYQPTLIRVLATFSLSGQDWVIITLSCLLPILIVETAKAIARKRKLQPAKQSSQIA